MANRKEVFQEKLMRRLYPAPPKTETPPAALTNPGPVSEKPCAVMKTMGGTVTEGEKGRSNPPLRRVYTVLPPPEGYRAADGESSAFLEPGDANNEGGAAAETREESSPEPGDRGRPRRRRKRKTQGAAGGGAGGAEEQEEERETGGAGEEEEVRTAGADPKTSRNRRRKEKKRRRRERLLSQGLVHGASAVEFTYQPGPAEEEEEEEEEGQGEGKLAELLDFLQATREMCLSDRGSSAAAQVPDSLMKGLTAGPGGGAGAPLADLPRLRRLRALVLRRDAGGLAAALEEYRLGSAMDPAETSAVCSLFRYWLTDILPVQSDVKWAGSPAPTPATQQEPAL